jgi:hypothetical protein
VPADRADAGITTNAIVLVGYAIGNAAAPFMWKAKYQPRNVVPWAVITASSVVSAALLVAIRALLVAENRRRDAARVDDAAHDEAYISVVGADGVQTEKRVDRVRVRAFHRSAQGLINMFRRSWTSPTARTLSSATCCSRRLARSTQCRRCSNISGT